MTRLTQIVALQWLHDMGDRVRERAELAAQSMASLVQGAARTMRAGLDRSASDAFDAPAVQGAVRHHHLAQEHGLGGQGRQERDRQRQRLRELQQDGPEIGGM